MSGQSIEGVDWIEGKNHRPPNVLVWGQPPSAARSSEARRVSSQRLWLLDDFDLIPFRVADLKITSARPIPFNCSDSSGARCHHISHLADNVKLIPF